MAAFMFTQWLHQWFSNAIRDEGAGAGAGPWNLGFERPALVLN